MRLSGAASFHRPWTSDEIQEMRTMGNLGFSQREIGARIGRTKAAINCMRQHLGLKIFVKPKPGPKPKNVKVEKRTPALTILKKDLAEYYELGWEVVAFDGEMVDLEWQRQSAPKIPENSADRDAVNASVSQYEVA